MQSRWSGCVGAVVLLHDIDILIGAAEEEPSEAFHLRIVEQLICPHQPAYQLNLRSGQVFTGGGDIVHGEGDDDPFADLSREDVRVLMLGAEDFNEVAAPRREVEYLPAGLGVHAV